MASLMPSLFEYANATMPRLRQKSMLLTSYLESLLDRRLMGKVHVITPRDPQQRGAQLSVRILSPFDGVQLSAAELEHKLADHGMIVDKRDPDILRVAPKPMYNSFLDVHRFVSFLEDHLVEEKPPRKGTGGSSRRGGGGKRGGR